MNTPTTASAHIRIPENLDMLATCAEIAANGALRRARELADAGNAGYWYELDTLSTLAALDLLDPDAQNRWVEEMRRRFNRAIGLTPAPTAEVTP